MLVIYFSFVNLNSEKVTGGYRATIKVPCQVRGELQNEQGRLKIQGSPPPIS